MFQSFLETRKSSSVYKVDCQCLSEVEYILDDILPYCDIKEQHYKNVNVLDKNYNQFTYNGIVYSINTYKHNRNIKFVSIESQEEKADSRVYSQEDSSRENSHTSNDDSVNTSSNDASNDISSNGASSNDDSPTSNDTSNDSHLSEDDLRNDNLNDGELNDNSLNDTLNLTDTSFNTDITTTSVEDISDLFEEIRSRIYEITPTEYTNSNYTNSNYTNGFSNEYNLLENSCVRKHQRDDLDDSDTSASITDLIDNMYSSKTSFTEYYVICEKHFSGQNYEIAVYSIYQNNYMIKTFVLFDDVYLFRYFYKEPYLFDTFQSIVGHYGYLNNESLQKDKMYYFYKIDHLERYVIKLYVYQLNQGKWCSWNAETNIILGLDLSRPFYIVQFLESIDNKQEKIYIDLLNRTGTNIDDRVMFIQNIFGKEFVYPRQSTTMSQNDQGVILETSEGSTRQFLW